MRSFIAGLDLGQAQDYTALGILETDAGRSDLRHLHRWDLGTPYPQIVADLGRLMAADELGGACTLIVDATGVGRPVIDLLRQAKLRYRPVVITGGDAVTEDAGWYHVPKRDLVSALVVAFETDKLRVAASLEFGPILRRELGAFRAKISLAGNASFEAWREKDHDDLVLAVALAAWLARRTAQRKI